MNRVECSKEAPWGIHQALREHECPRCGWGPDRDEPTAELQGWTLAIGGLSPSAVAA